MSCIVTNTIGFLSKTFPKIYSSLYLDYLKKYSALYNVNKTQLRALVFIKNHGSISMTELCAKLNIEKGSLTSMIDDLTKKGYEVVDTIISEDAPENIDDAIFYLSKSIEFIGKVDAVVFMPGWEKARGCRIEYLTAKEYGKFIKEL